MLKVEIVHRYQKLIAAGADCSGNRDLCDVSLNRKLFGIAMR